jgi:phosphoenolpyruvate carboxylase
MSSRLITVDADVQRLAELAMDTSPYRRDEPYRQALRGMHARLAATALNLVGRVPGVPPIGDRPAYDGPGSCSPTST